jgi:small-conductance mechanosensitive channel
MEEFKPSRWLGLSTGIVLVLLVLAGDAFMIWGISQVGISLAGFTLVLLLIASLFILFFLGYWLYGLLWSGYYVDRNALVIRWGATTQVVPLESVDAVLSDDQLKGTTHFRGLIWPGLRVGYGEIEDVGSTLFYAAGSLRRQVVLTTPALAYAISPADQAAFLEVLRHRLNMGPTQSVEQASQQPSFLMWSFWSDRLGFALLVCALVLLFALFGFIALRYPSLAELQPLHFDTLGQPDRWGTRVQVFTLPFIGLLALIANGGLGFLLYERERSAAYLLWSGAIGVQLLVWGATLGILR